ncbi:hypothetical protein BP5796_07817 [Coleophoma crateriformis]|uniref:Aminoglycoside phosphotransferase domain-containing protein n=1 Tax=Coleophoma crateriformis TaxID=565419 RepID=A0A3D8RCK2_9HELO|nr:hypothetical protein BP5796_07817 [Coleophoma crateriformis]
MSSSMFPNVGSVFSSSRYRKSAPHILSLPLLQGMTTLTEALDGEDNMLVHLGYPSQRDEFFLWILQHHRDFEAVVAFHLSFAAEEICRLGDIEEWKQGSFNVGIPVYIENWKTLRRRRVLLRIPLPYKAGELLHPGNADEKLRSEAATFVWIQENFPDVPMPQLLGFGFSGGQSFLRPENVSFGTRFLWYSRRAILSFFGKSCPCSYVRERRLSILEHGYLITNYIEPSDAKTLSETWSEFCQSQKMMTNLFKDLSRIILSLSQRPLPCIGSWTMDDAGWLTLTNRPFIHQLQFLENEGIPTNIPRDLTYTNTDVFYADLFDCHDSRIRVQPNSIANEKDGQAQMANLFMMRGLLSHFTDRSLRHGPFVFNLTDLHGSNIFVDEDWHVRYVIDLEWACSLPVEMLSPPYWITSRPVDELEGEELPIFEAAYHDFTNIFEEEEKNCPPMFGSSTCRTDIMRRGWKIGNFWYFHALKSPIGLFNLFRQHVQPVFEAQGEKANFDIDRFSDVVSPYWAPDAQETVLRKLEDKKQYEQELRNLFEEHGQLLNELP